MNTKPTTISDFRHIGKKRINCKVNTKRGAIRTIHGNPMPTTPEEAKELHDKRTKENCNRYLAEKLRKEKWGKIVVDSNLFERGQYADKATIPLGQLSVSPREYRRAENWRKYHPIFGKTYEKKVGNGTHGGWPCFAYDHFVQSWGAVSPTGSKMHYCIDMNSVAEKTIKAPRGWKWKIDANGIKIVANSDRRCDYHPTAYEILRLSTIQLCSKARENLARRKILHAENRIKAKQANEAQEAVKRAIKRAEREGATICLADSIRAGNCLAGSQQWAQRHGFDPRRHYQPSEVLAKANGDAHRVALVVNVGLRRHRAEMERGYAELSEHGILENSK